MAAAAVDTSLRCPVCMEIAIDAMSAACGHTVCGPCSRRLQTEACPECRAARATYVPNYMVRRLLDAPQFEEAVKKRRLEIEPTPEELVSQALARLGAVITKKNSFKPRETLLLIGLAEEIIKRDTDPEDVLSIVNRFNKKHRVTCNVITFTSFWPNMTAFARNLPRISLQVGETVIFMFGEKLVFKL